VTSTGIRGSLRYGRVPGRHRAGREEVYEVVEREREQGEHGGSADGERDGLRPGAGDQVRAGRRTGRGRPDEREDGEGGGPPGVAPAQRGAGGAEAAARGTYPASQRAKDPDAERREQSGGQRQPGDGPHRQHQRYRQFGAEDCRRDRTGGQPADGHQPAGGGDEGVVRGPATQLAERRDREHDGQRDQTTHRDVAHLHALPVGPMAPSWPGRTARRSPRVRPGIGQQVPQLLQPHGSQTPWMQSRRQSFE